MNEEKERLLFEQWFTGSIFQRLERDFEGDYTNQIALEKWFAWKARAQLENDSKQTSNTEQVPPAN